jgi:hypothetical protein
VPLDQPIHVGEAGAARTCNDAEHLVVVEHGRQVDERTSGVVVRIEPTVVRSRSGTSRTRWSTTPMGLAPVRLLRPTWGSEGPCGTIPCNHAALGPNAAARWASVATSSAWWTVTGAPAIVNTSRWCRIHSPLPTRILIWRSVRPARWASSLVRTPCAFAARCRSRRSASTHPTGARDARDVTGYAAPVRSGARW